MFHTPCLFSVSSYPRTLCASWLWRKKQKLPTKRPKNKKMRLLNLLGRYPRRNGLVHLNDGGAGSLCVCLSSSLASSSTNSKRSEPPELKDFTDYLDSLRNYEKLGVPKGAGTDSNQGFDLDPMTRLLYRLGLPQSKFKAIHIAGTKGKGSTAAFISNILRAQGYSVGCYTSPHILSVRERMSLGKSGEPVSADRLNGLFQQIRPKLDKAIQQERGRLSHFEVLTAIAFTLFAEEKVDIAVIEAGLGGARDATNVISASELLVAVITTIGEEHLAALGGSLESIAMAKAGIIKNFRPLVLGGPFLPHIECILRDYAYLKSSPVVLASDTGVKTIVKGIDMFGSRPYQLSDIMIQMDRSFRLSIELSDLKLQMLGSHQLQNASTAVCTALWLHDQGWSISEESIRAGLENTLLIGRSQFLSSKESKALGLPGATVLLDGAHTKESARALVDTIQMSFPEARLGLVVAMATDKDHIAFAREFLSSGQLAVVSLIENEIGGGKHRTTPASVLRDCWIQASQQLGINILHDEMAEYRELLEDRFLPGGGVSEDRILLHTAGDRLQVEDHIWQANDFLRLRTRNQQSVLVVTGSLHIVSSVLVALNKHNAPCSITDN